MSPEAHVPGYWRRHFAAAFRVLHIYLSMISFAVLFFFAATGITLNHADWLTGGPPHSRIVKGSVDPRWVRGGDESNVAKLEVVEHLRSADGVKGALGDFAVEADRCFVEFRGPGYTADATIDRATGKYDLTETRMGLVAVVNDLHKGRDSGAVWRWVIDVAGALMVLVSLTGMALIFYLKRRRFLGLCVAVGGAALCGLLYIVFVP